MTVNVSIASNAGTFEGGNFTIGPVQIDSTFASLGVSSLTFGSGTFLSTTGPAGAFGCLIQPPSTNAVQLTLKGITGDTGIPISASNPTLITFFTPTSANTIGLASASAVSGVVTLTFF